MLRLIGRLIMFAIKLPLYVGIGLLQAIGIFPVTEVESFEDEQADNRIDDLESLSNVKRWAAATIRHQPAPCLGGYSAWLRGLDRESAFKIANAAATGQLENHLANRVQFIGLPPVGNTDQTLQWLKDRASARRRMPEAAVIERALSPRPPRELMPDRRLRDGRQGRPQPA